MVLGLSLLHCCNKRKVVASLDDPVRVEWVYERKLHGRGRLGGIDETGTLYVARVPPTELRANCWQPSPELRATPVGTELAYRCAPEQTWQLVYFAKSRPLGFQLPDSPLGTGEQPAFERIEPFEKVASALVEHMQEKPHNYEMMSRDVYEEVLERGGPEALFAALSATRKLAFAYDETHTPNDLGFADPWAMMAARLPKHLAERLDAELRRDLSASKLEPAHLERAVWRMAPNDAKLAPALERHATEHAAKGSTPAVALVLARLVAHDGERAGEIACRALSATKNDLDPYPAEATLFAIVAKSGSVCGAVSARLRKRPCSTEHDCGPPSARRLCTKADLAVPVDQHLGSRSKWNAPSKLGADAALLAAAYAQGELPQRVKRAAARRRYAILDEGVSCAATDGGKSSCPCIAYLEDPSGVACSVDPEQSIGRHLGNCTLRVDDAAERIEILPYFWDGGERALPDGQVD